MGRKKLTFVEKAMRTIRGAIFDAWWFLMQNSDKTIAIGQIALMVPPLLGALDSSTVFPVVGSALTAGVLGAFSATFASIGHRLSAYTSGASAALWGWLAVSG